MPKITNKNYRNFMDKGEIELLTQEELKEALNNVKGIHGKHIKEGRSLLIVLYYTGCRPIEALMLKGKDIYKEGSYIKINIPTAKKGKTRKISLPYRLKYPRELYHFTQSNFEERFLFYNYRSNRIKTYKTKDSTEKEYKDLSSKLRFHVMKWFKSIREGSITPYFLRHNRFSQLANAGVESVDIQFLKGGRRIDSVDPYLHLSKKKSEELAKKIK